MRLENVGNHKEYNYKNDLGRHSDDFLSVNACGYYQIDTYTNTSNRKNGRIDYQILYVAKNKIEVEINDEKMWIKEGTLVLYRPFEPQWYRYHAEDQAEIYWMHFTGEGVKSILDTLGFGEKNVFNVGKSEKLYEYFRMIIGELQIQREDYEKNCNKILLMMLSEFASLIAAKQDAVQNNRYRDLQSVIEHMNHKCAGDTDVDQYAKMCNMSKYHFMRIFKDQMGISPYAYKIKVRIRRARDLLHNTNMSIAEIANLLGYADASCFSKQFKKEVGVSPLEYKKIR